MCNRFFRIRQASVVSGQNTSYCPVIHVSVRNNIEETEIRSYISKQYSILQKQRNQRKNSNRGQSSNHGKSEKKLNEGIIQNLKNK